MNERWKEQVYVQNTPVVLSPTDLQNNLNLQGKYSNSSFINYLFLGWVIDMYTPDKIIFLEVNFPIPNPRGRAMPLHNEELHSLYSSSNVVSVIKSTRLRWAGHEAR